MAKIKVQLNSLISRVSRAAALMENPEDQEKMNHVGITLTDILRRASAEWLRIRSPRGPKPGRPKPNGNRAFICQKCKRKWSNADGMPRGGICVRCREPYPAQAMELMSAIDPSGEAAKL